MSKKPANKYNPHLSEEDIKRHSINIKFTQAEFEEIMEVVEFSGEKRMNMCCTGVMRYVRELKKQMVEGKQKGITRRGMTQEELRDKVMSLRTQKESIGGIAHKLNISQKRVMEILAEEPNA